MIKLASSATFALALALVPAVASAKGGTPQNHHCMKDGAELTGKTKKECKKEGGTWDKLPAAAAPAAEGATKDAASKDAAPKAPAKAEAKPEAKAEAK